MVAGGASSCDILPTSIPNLLLNITQLQSISFILPIINHQIRPTTDRLVPITNQLNDSIWLIKCATYDFDLSPINFIGFLDALVRRLPKKKYTSWFYQLITICFILDKSWPLSHILIYIFSSYFFFFQPVLDLIFSLIYYLFRFYNRQQTLLFVFESLVNKIFNAWLFRFCKTKAIISNTLRFIPNS